MSADLGYRLNQYRLLPARRLLLDGERPLKLGSRAFDMLVVLVENRHRIVGKHELMDLVWPGLVVEENNLQVQVLALRKLLGHPAIGTIPGRGYQFTLPVAVESAGGEAPAAEGAGSPPAAPLALPPSLVPMVGRDDELRTVQRLIGTHRLVTVAGAGGIGKTRLAQGVAVAEAGRQADGVWWVELAGLEDAALVPMAVAQALGLQPTAEADITRAVVRALEGKAALLVLDNAEHVLTGVTALVDRLRQQAAGVRLLVTSQEVLRTWEEQVFRPGPLGLPPDEELATAQASGAVALFVARAQLAQPRFTLTEGNRAAVVEICRRLDGIPLAIELAAARVPLLGVEGVRARLDQRFHVLTAGARAVMRRHQTLRAALEWSHGLLDDDEQRVFRRLGVFAGGFTLEAAQAVVECERIDPWDALEHLGNLVDKSLVLAEGDAVPRYRLLETSRLYALERLAEAGETEPLLRRHAEFLLREAEALDEQASRHGQAGALIDRLDAERDNLLHALSWAAQAADEEAAMIGLRLAAALRYYWSSRGLLALGVEVTLRALERARRLPVDGHRCKALASASLMLRWQGQDDRSLALAAELQTAADAVGDRHWSAVSLFNQGWVERSRGRYPEAERCFRRMLADARALGSTNLEGNALSGLVDVLDHEGQQAAATELFEQLLAVRRRAGNGFNLAITLQQAADRSRRQGDLPQSRARLSEALQLAIGAGSKALLSSQLCAVADHLAAQTRWAEAAELWAAATARRRDAGLQIDDDSLEEQRRNQAEARRSLGDGTYAEAWQRGEALADAEALQRAADRLA